MDYLGAFDRITCVFGSREFFLVRSERDVVEGDVREIFRVRRI